MSQRGHNEGTIFKRADGRWCGQVSLDGGKRKSVYGRTRQDVARKLIEVFRDRDRGLPIVAERQTLAQYLVSWLDAKAHQLDVATQERYGQLIRLHILPVLGKAALTKLNAQQVQALYANKISEGLSARTVRQLHVVLKSALKSAVRLGIVQFNVCERVDPPRPSRSELHPLTPEQAQAFLRATHGDRLEALFVLAVHTGMRQGELLGLRWSDVILDSATLQVRGTLQRVPGHKRIKDPKTASSRRRVTLSAQAVEALRAHRTRQLAERIALGPEWSDEDLVFPGPSGHPLNYRGMTDDHFKRALRRADVPEIRFHDLRHTCATLLLLGGVHPKIVSEMLGHSTISITLDTYSHVLPTMQRDAAATLERLFGS